MKLNSVKKFIESKKGVIKEHYVKEHGDLIRDLMLEYLIFELNGIEYVISASDISYIMTDVENIEDYYSGYSLNQLKKVIDRLSITKFAN